MSLISILIPTYAPGDYVKNCFESIERQSLSKDLYYVYVALNGPHGEYEAFLKRLLSEFSFNWKFFYLTVPGVSNARNFLIDISNEEYIAFVDDDDVMSSNYLEELLRVSSSRSIGISNCFDFDTLGGPHYDNYIGRSFKSLDDVNRSKFKSRKYFSSPWAKLIHRSMVDNVRFDTSLSVGEDSLFMATISSGVYSLNKTDSSACYFVYNRIGSVTRRKINKFNEFSRVFYLLGKYSKMLFTSKYEKLFIVSRIVATIVHLRKLFL